MDIVFDSIGRDTFEKLLDCLRPLGFMVNLGERSRSAVRYYLLAQKGSVFLAKPSLATFTQDRQDLLDLARGGFDAIRTGAISVEIGLTAPLDDVASVHARIENRQTTASTVLIPGWSAPCRSSHSSVGFTSNLCQFGPQLLCAGARPRLPFNLGWFQFPHASGLGPRSR